jgi:hypothetical protein
VTAEGEAIVEGSRGSDSGRGGDRERTKGSGMREDKESPTAEDEGMAGRRYDSGRREDCGGLRESDSGRGEDREDQEGSKRRKGSKGSRNREDCREESYHCLYAALLLFCQM